MLIRRRLAGSELGADGIEILTQAWSLSNSIRKSWAGPRRLRKTPSIPAAFLLEVGRKGLRRMEDGWRNERHATPAREPGVCRRSKAASCAAFHLDVLRMSGREAGELA